MSHPAIIVMSGLEAGNALNVDEVLNNFSIGSDHGCNLVVSGISVSPMHASVFLDDDGVVTISDTNSATGVFVNGVQIMEQALVDGDQISLGPPDHPGSDLLSFAAYGVEAAQADVPLVDLSGFDAPALSGLEGLDAPLEENLFTSELGRPGFAAPASPFEPAPTPDFDLTDIPALDILPEVPALEPAAPAFDDFPPPDMLASSEPEPEPEPVPEFIDPPAPAPKPVSKASGVRPSRAAAAPAAPKPSSSDPDPLAGLAESLGGSSSRTFQPPPAVDPAPVSSAKAKKSKATPAVMAARVAVVAVVLASLAWFGTHRYSNSIALPVVDSFLPNPAEPGQTVTINGSGFEDGPEPASFKVLLGDAPAQMLDANATRINIMIPESLASAGSQTLSLKVMARGTASTSRLLKIVVAPKIASLTPRVALSGDEVAIAGKWFGNGKVKPVVAVAGNEAEILEAGPNAIRIKVPQVAATEGQKVSVRVSVGPDVGKEAPLHYGRLPFVESVLPARALPGDVMTISGLGLSASDLSVKVSGRTAVILSGTDAEIKASVPGMRLTETAGQRAVTVQANGRLSLEQPIEILHESSTLYSPRFFAEGLEGGRIAISCELGPIMVLGSDAASHARAHDAAAKLNGLIAQARAARVQFSSSDVTISGPRGPVLSLAGADGAGNPRGLAPLWAAMLTDMFDLFFQGRRPGRTVELSPDGKVFVDIFAAARRRSAEAGVSPSVIYSTDPSWARSIATLASAPVLGSSGAIALLDGYWSGVIEVPGAILPRKIEISLTATPSGLMGQRTSRRGGLSTVVSLEGLRYSRRELRFSFVDNGENLNYSGVLDGDEIDGNVTKGSGAKVGRLKFKLTR